MTRSCQEERKRLWCPLFLKCKIYFCLGLQNPNFFCVTLLHFFFFATLLLHDTAFQRSSTMRSRCWGLQIFVCGIFLKKVSFVERVETHTLCNAPKSDKTPPFSLMVFWEGHENCSQFSKWSLKFTCPTQRRAFFLKWRKSTLSPVFSR